MPKSTESEQNAPSEAVADRLLDAVLGLVVLDGWTKSVLDQAAAQEGLSDGQVMLAAPNGIASLLERLGDRAAQAAERRMGDADVGSMKIRDKVAVGVKAYVAFLNPNKAALKRAAGSPWNLFAGPTALWKGADAIWSGLGDASTDFNWYTKRMTLSAVLGSTLLAWLGTDDAEAVDDFLDHRIDNVMQFEKAKKQVQDLVSRFPDPFDILGPKRDSK